MPTTDDEMTDTVATSDAEQLELFEPSDGEVPGGRAGSGWRSAGWILAAVFLVLAVVMSVVAAQVNEERSADEAAREDVTRLANEVTSALLTFDHANPDAQRERVHQLGDQGLAEEYETSLASLKTSFIPIQGVTTPTIKDAYVGEIEEGEAQVIVVADFEVTTPQQRRLVNNVYTLVYVRKIDGTWKAIRVDSLNFGGASGLTQNIPADGATTTTTTAPPG